MPNGVLCHYAVMEETAAFQQAAANLKEAERQLKKAEKDRQTGAIDDERLAELKHLRDIAADDMRRVSKEPF